VQPAHSIEDLPRYEWLISADGDALMSQIGERLVAGESILRLSEILRKGHDLALVALALTQVELRTRARAKFVDADRLLFTREGLEQATSEAISRYRAGRFADSPRIIDLCCGIGGDLMALSALPNVTTLAAVDLDPVHLLLARHNAAVIAPDQAVSSVLDDVRDVSIHSGDAVFIDPARRDTRGRMGGYTSEPPLEWSLALADRASALGIKAAPGIPHDLVPPGWEMETIALDSDLKEAVLWSPALATASRRATILIGDRVHSLQPVPGEAVGIREPRTGDVLLDPNPAITRAGLVEDLARTLGADKIDDEIGFLMASHPLQTPFGRSLPVIASMPWHEKKVKSFLRQIDAGPVDIRRRGLAGDVSAITRRLRGSGSRPVTIAMTRFRGNPWAVICDMST
jgi:hypothetical protein